MYFVEKQKSLLEQKLIDRQTYTQDLVQQRSYTILIAQDVVYPGKKEINCAHSSALSIFNDASVIFSRDCTAQMS